MKGQLSEQPLAELIREISAKQLSGRLQVQQNRVSVACYFKDGTFRYAVANARNLRLREYLIKSKSVPEQQMLPVGANVPDLQLAASLVAKNIIQTTVLREIQLKQLADVLRLALLWIEGTWEFDLRAHLNEPVDLSLDPAALFLEVGRRLPRSFAASRFRNDKEMLTLSQSSAGMDVLQPKEGFILSRLDRATPLKDLIALSGLPENEALHVIYALALSGYIVREDWISAFPDAAERIPRRRVEPEKEAPEIAEQPVLQLGEDEIRSFLERVQSASTYYEVLGIANDASAVELKQTYYDLARRYHPDRFRRKRGITDHSQFESAFARITQAYETLREPASRSRYDSKLAALARARSAQSSNQMSSGTASRATLDAALGQRAENHFREGLSALKSGDLKAATSSFASAARAVPNDARYRAFYGNALAENETNRRLAEAELQAAVKLEPENADYRIMLAQLYKTLGFSRRARAEAQRVLASSPSHQGALELLRNLPRDA
ncbi:MAG TPA: DnaJ domain-containing protein [Pyrinomonadaceae bacterium]|jgi:curved DNA-binding protein CbpA